jgi:hypothetical protein
MARANDTLKNFDHQFNQVSHLSRNRYFNLLKQNDVS